MIDSITYIKELQLEAQKVEKEIRTAVTAHNGNAVKFLESLGVKVLDSGNNNINHSIEAFSSKTARRRLEQKYA